MRRAVDSDINGSADTPTHSVTPSDNTFARQAAAKLKTLHKQSIKIHK